jgi:hypothetical protein
MHNESQENARHLANVPDRAAGLIAELDETQRQQLLDALGTMSYAEWLDWLEASRVVICRYDALKPSERKRQFAKRAQAFADSDPLLLHHACIWLELWRARISTRFLPLPPAGLPLDSPESQRQMMLAVVAAYHDYDLLDFWPFDTPEVEDSFPFRE